MNYPKILIKIGIILSILTSVYAGKNLTNKITTDTDAIKAVIANELKTMEKHLNDKANINTNLSEDQLKNDLLSHISNSGSIIAEYNDSKTSNKKSKHNINLFINDELMAMEKHLNDKANINTNLSEDQLKNDLLSHISNSGSIIAEYNDSKTSNKKSKHNINLFINDELMAMEKYLNDKVNINTNLSEDQLKNDLLNYISNSGSAITEYNSNE